MSEKEPSDEANAFENPTGMAARLRDLRSRDAGVISVAGRDKHHFKDPNLSSAISAIAGSTSIKLKASKPSLGTSALAEQQTRDEIDYASKKLSLRKAADVARLSLHDSTPRGRPVNKLPSAPPRGILKKKDSSSDVDPDLVSAIEELVASRQGDESVRSTSSDLASLTQQIQKLAESRRASLAQLSSTTSELPPKKEETPRPAKSPASTSSNQLDLKNNDNAFSVIANLVLESFNHDKEEGSLIASGQAQLDRSLPTHVRQGFVEAVQYRLETNCPPGSTEPIHVLTRKCQDLGLARNDDTNTLLTKTTTVDVSNVSSAASLVSVFAVCHESVTHNVLTRLPFIIDLGQSVERKKEGKHSSATYQGIACGVKYGKFGAPAACR